MTIKIKQKAALLIFAALLLNCQPEIRYADRGTTDTSGEIDKIPAPPRLSVLSIDGADGSPVLAFTKPDGKSGTVPVTFNPDAYNYSVIFDEYTPSEVYINAKPMEDADESIVVECITAPQFKVTPADKLFVVVNVTNEVSLRRSTYTVQFSRSPLPPARITGIMLSAGKLLDSTGWQADSFAPSPGYEGYIHRVEVPFGVRQVSVWPQTNEAGAFFTYTPSIPIALEMHGDVYKSDFRIEIAAPGKSPSVYGIEITEGAARESELLGLSLSTGALTTEDGTPDSFRKVPPIGFTQYISVPMGTERLVVAAVKKHFSDKTSWNNGFYGDAKAFDASENGGTLNDISFNIFIEEEVKNGYGYTARIYDFRIIEAGPDTPQASLSEDDGLEVVSANAALFGRDAETGNNDGSGYDAATSLYNLEFAPGASNIVLRARAKEGFTLDVSGGGTGVSVSGSDFEKIIEYSTPKANDPPIKIRGIGEEGVLAREYTVYLKKNPVPDALLSGIIVAGGIFVDPSDTSQMVFFNPDIKNYTINVEANIGSVIVTGHTDTQPDGTELSVSYTPSNFLSGISLVTGSTIKVKVSGGRDWAETEYTLTINKLNSRPARLSLLKVNETYLVGTEGAPGTGTHPLVYGPDTTPPLPAFPFSETSDPAVFVWETQDSAVTVEYAVDDDMWIGADSGFDHLSVGPSESRLVLIKVFSPDEGTAIYRVYVSKEGNSFARLASLGISPGTGVFEPVFSGTVYTYTLTMPNGVSGNIAFTPVLDDASGGAALHYSIDNETYAAYTTAPIQIAVPSPGITKRLIIQAAPHNGSTFNSYTVLIRQTGSEANALVSLAVEKAAGTAWAGGASFAADDLDGDDERNRSVSLPSGVSKVNITATGPALSVVSAPSGYTDSDARDNWLALNDVPLNMLEPKPIAITVIAQNGEPRLYTLTLVRGGPADLDGLEAAGFDLRQNITGNALFNSRVRSYKVLVNTNSITFTPILTADGRTYKHNINGAGFAAISGNETIQVNSIAAGITKLVIRVTPGISGDHVDYNVDIYKPPLAEGGTVTYYPASGIPTDEIHSFETAGGHTFSFKDGIIPSTITGGRVLVVAGGGGGGGGGGGDTGGGGGAGGLLYNDTFSFSNLSYSVTVGAGGAGGGGGAASAHGGTGGASSFPGFDTANGGGYGGFGGGSVAESAGGNGGSGGGGGAGGDVAKGRAGTGSQGKNGAEGSAERNGGGGGGYTQAGSSPGGGEGFINDIRGDSNPEHNKYAYGGPAGTGNGEHPGADGTTPDHPGSGGGGGTYSRPGRAGTTGVVIVRFKLP